MVGRGVGMWKTQGKITNHKGEKKSYDEGNNSVMKLQGWK